MKWLPGGVWIKLIDLADGIDERDVSKLFLDRTGVELPVERISIAEPEGHKRRQCVISLGGEHYREILLWAFSEDTLGGKPLSIISASRKTEGEGF